MSDQPLTAEDGGKTDAGLPSSDITKVTNSEAGQPATAQQLQLVENQMSSFEKATLHWAKLAVWMSGLAALFVCLQWYEMHTGGQDTHNLAVAAKAQADDLRQQQRAWIAPKNATLRSGLLVAGKPILLDISYDNVGQEPALDSHGIYRFRHIPDSAFADNSINTIIEEIDICKDVPAKLGADVVYPRAGGYTLRFSATGDWITQESIDEKQAIVFQMCIAYNTTGETHRTAFCYWYRPGIKEPNQLNICTAGNHAD